MGVCSKCQGPLSGHSKYGVCKRTPECLKENMRLQSAAARARNPETYKEHFRSAADRKATQLRGPRPTCKLCGLPTIRGTVTGICTRPTCEQANRDARHDVDRERMFRGQSWDQRVPVGTRFFFWTTCGLPYREHRQGKGGRKYSIVLVDCRCDCGTTATVATGSLLNGGSRSCGCKGLASRRWLIQQKVEVGKCVDCGLICTEENYFCFDWDHRPGVEKLINVSAMSGLTQEIVKAEIAKCDLRCANCHRMATLQRGDTTPRRFR